LCFVCMGADISVAGDRAAIEGSCGHKVTVNSQKVFLALWYYAGITLVPRYIPLRLRAVCSVQKVCMPTHTCERRVMPA